MKKERYQYSGDGFEMRGTGEMGEKGEYNSEGWEREEREEKVKEGEEGEEEGTRKLDEEREGMGWE